VTLQAAVQIVAGLGAGGEQAGGCQRAEDTRGAQTALHAQPEQVEAGVVGDDLDRLESRLQVAEVVADGAQVEQDRCLIRHAEAQQADVARPGIETIALARAVGFQIESDGSRFTNRGGKRGEFRGSGDQPADGHLGHFGHVRPTACTYTLFILSIFINL
jgi:hypothetical protein